MREITHQQRVGGERFVQQGEGTNKKCQSNVRRICIEIFVHLEKRADGRRWTFSVEAKDVVIVEVHIETQWLAHNKRQPHGHVTHLATLWTVIMHKQSVRLLAQHPQKGPHSRHFQRH